MKILFLSPILFLAIAATDCHHPVFAAADVGGKWQVSFSTPHGEIEGALDIKQDGEKLSGTCSSDHFGAVPLTGDIDGKKVSFTIEVQGMSFKMIGDLAGEKMTGTIEPDFGTWTATRPAAAAVHRQIRAALPEFTHAD